MVIVPVAMATSARYSALYYFGDTSFILQDGTLDYVYILQQEAIQISLVFVSIFVVTFVEARFNRVNLTSVVRNTSLVQYVSQTLIYLWGVLLFFSSVKTTPNYFQCDDMTVCHCNFRIPIEKYGC